MRKRPLCLAAVLFLGIQTVLTGGFQLAKDLKPSGLENRAEEGDTLTLQGIVFRREEKAEYQVYYLTDNQVRLDNQIVEKEVPFIEESESQNIEESKILVYFKHEKSQNQKIAIGNTIQVRGSVSFFQEAVNPGNFDQKFYYQKQGIHACVWADEVKKIDASVFFVREKLAVLRSRWKELLVECLGEYYGNSMSAILLGDKSELDADLKDLYQKSGIGHILAISGLHMSFIGIGLYRLLRKLGLGFLPAGGIGIVFLTLYTLMIGCGVSSLRALVMFAVRIGADMCGRDYDMPTSLSLAAAVIVLWQPLYLMDAGFLLSFGAILGVTLLNPVLEACHTVPKLLCAGISIHLTLLPVFLYYYFELPPYSLLLNLFVIPLMSLVLGVGILGSLLYLVWQGAGTAVLQICRLVLWLYEQAGEITMKLPLGRLILGQPRKIWMVFYYILLFGGCLLAFWCWKRSSKAAEHIQRTEKHMRLVIRAGVFFLPVFFCLLCRLGHGKPGEIQVTALDVGQGDGLYIRTPSGGHYFMDGGSSDIKNVGRYRIEPFLKSQGAGILDYVFISHGDTDHISGIQEMLENQVYGIRIQTLVLPPEPVLDENLRELAVTAWENGTTVVTIQEGQKITDAGMTMTCLAPSDEYSGEIGNASSMILELQYKAFDMLFTGDVEGKGEEALIKSGLLKQYDVLKVAHHGSKNSTKEEFLEQTEPEIALISAGRDNQYGHPHEETLQRLNAHGARVFSTADCGAVILHTDGERMTICGYLEK